MLLRNSISSTRKFFQRTLGSLKSLFSGGSYEKLPKSPPNNANSGSSTTRALDMNIKQRRGNSDKLFNDSTLQWGSGDSATRACERINKVKITSNPSKGDHKDQDGHDDHKKPSVLGSSMARKINKSEIMERRDHKSYPSKVVIVKRKEDYFSNDHEEGIMKKLKELEMLDMSNVDHVLDIEEVLHYYSRLTCPAYLEIVDKFFIEIFAEFFGSSTPIRTINSKLMKPKSVTIKSSRDNVLGRN